MSALALSCAVAATVAGVVVLSPSPAAEAGKNRVVLELQAGPDEAVAIAAAQTTCNSLNLPDEEIEVDTARAAAVDALGALQAALDEASAVTDTIFVLEGVPDDVVVSYRDNQVPLRKLFASATGLEASSKTVIEARQWAAPDELISLPKVTAPLKSTVTQHVDQAAKQLDEAVARLPIVDRVAVLGPDAIDALALTDDELDEVLSSGGGQSFAAEKERRYVADLPDLSQSENGFLSDDLLCPIPWSPEYRLLCPAVEKLVGLNDAFKAEFGHDLAIQSAYRSYEQQVAAHQNSPLMTTVPGSSNHSWGLAVDFDIDAYRRYDHPEVVWLVENGPTHGWRNPTLESFETANEEPWHFEFGTTYPRSADGGFNGPTPLVEYVVRLPEGAHPQTLLSSGGEENG